MRSPRHRATYLSKLGLGSGIQISRWITRLNEPGLTTAGNDHSRPRVRLREPGLDVGRQYPQELRTGRSGATSRDAELAVGREQAELRRTPAQVVEDLVGGDVQAAGQRHQIAQIRDVEVADPQFLIRPAFRRPRKALRVSASGTGPRQCSRDTSIQPVFSPRRLPWQACTVPSLVA